MCHIFKQTRHCDKFWILVDSQEPEIMYMNWDLEIGFRNGGTRRLETPYAASQLHASPRTPENVTCIESIDSTVTLPTACVASLQQLIQGWHFPHPALSLCLCL